MTATSDTRFKQYQAECDELDAIDFAQFDAGFRYRGMENWFTGFMVGCVVGIVLMAIARGGH